MEIIKQQWFWNYIFPLITLILGSLLTIFANYWKEKSNRNTQIRLEKIKMYDERKFQAYLDLYEFISKAYSVYWPPDNPRQDFVYTMKEHFFKKAKFHYPYFDKKIRDKIKILESQYTCLGDPDLKPDIPFKQFIDSEYLKILNELNQTVESIFDKWENN